MPTTTYTPLANITLAANAASVTFSSISQAYRDLVLVIAGTAVTSSNIQLQFNNVTSAAYWAGSYGGPVFSTVQEGSSYFLATSYNSFTTTQSNAICHIMDYSTTDRQKIVVSRANASDSYVAVSSGRFNSTTAISTVKVTVGGTMAAGTTLALYGIVA